MVHVFLPNDPVDVKSDSLKLSWTLAIFDQQDTPIFPIFPTLVEIFLLSLTQLRPSRNSTKAHFFGTLGVGGRSKMPKVNYAPFFFERFSDRRFLRDRWRLAPIRRLMVSFAIPIPSFSLLRSRSLTIDCPCSMKKVHKRQ